jgi:hypothetical protein
LQAGNLQYANCKLTKGEFAINWNDEEARRAFLQAIVTDADRLDEDQKRQVIVDSAELLGPLLLKDVDR